MMSTHRCQHLIDVERRLIPIVYLFICRSAGEPRYHSCWAESMWASLRYDLLSLPSITISASGSLSSFFSSFLSSPLFSPLFTPLLSLTLSSLFSSTPPLLLRPGISPFSSPSVMSTLATFILSLEILTILITRLRQFLLTFSFLFLRIGGGYAEYVTVHANIVIAVPEGLSLEMAAGTLLLFFVLSTVLFPFVFCHTYYPYSF